MAITAETIKEYLISIGFEVDDASFKKFQKSLQDSDKDAKGLGKTMADFAKNPAVIAATAIIAITAALSKMIESTIKADLEYQKFALRMYMSTEQAKKLKIAQTALGESLEDIAWNKELRGRYFGLMADQERMKLPADSSAEFQKMRDVTNEFRRLRMELIYLKDWFVYRVLKLIGMDAADFHQKFKALNDWIIENIPRIADALAPAGAAFMGLFKIVSKLIETTGGLRAWGGAFSGVINAIGAQMAAFTLITRTLMNLVKVIIALGFAQRGEAGKAWEVLKSDFMEDFGNYKRSATAAAKGFGGGPPDATGKGTGTGGDPLVRAIRQQESGGNYNAPHAMTKHGRPIGAYGILPSNWGPWSKEAGLPPGSQPTPENQDIVASFKLNQYRKKYGSNRAAAMAWYTGETNYDKIRSGLSTGNASQGMYPTVNAYGDSIERRISRDSTGGTHIGNIEVNVMQPNATPDEIRAATVKAIKDERDQRIAYNIREASGVLP